MMSDRMLEDPSTGLKKWEQDRAEGRHTLNPTFPPWMPLDSVLFFGSGGRGGCY